jgi:PAS domain S-box-containing protein
MLMSEDNQALALSMDGEIDSILLKSIVESTVDAIIVITGKGNICLTNPATERLFGYRASELTGKNVSMLMPEPYHSQHDSYLRNYLTSGEPKIIGIGRQVEGRRKDGSTFPMYLSVAEVRHGERHYFTGIIHDLSQQKAIESALRKSEQHLRDVTDAASDWTWEMDRRFRLSYVSNRFYTLTGVAPEGVVGRTHWELAREEPESPFWKEHCDDLEQHRPFRDFVFRPRFGDAPGWDFHFKVSGKPVFDELGYFHGYRGTGTDVTEHVLARRALRESRRSLETLMSNVPGMVYRCRNDRDRSMEFVSEGGKNLTGYHPAALVDGEVTLAGLIHDNDLPLVRKEIQTAVAMQAPFELTYRIRTATGEDRWVWEHGRGVRGDDGQVNALEGLILDISEQRQTESALRALAGTTAVGDSEDFISNCVRELALTYEARYCLVGVFDDATRTSIRTLAVWQGECFGDNFVYDLEGTPCSNIFDCRSDIIPRDAINRYPDDQLLKDLEVESYYGAALINSAGNTLGLVAVMDTKPMRPNVWTRPILGIFANRIALELERQQAEDQLRQSEAYMRLTLETAPIGIASADLRGRLLDVNPAFASLLGYTAPELVEKTIRDLTHPRDREEMRRHFEALVQGDISRYELEKRYLRKDGGVLHVRVQAGLVRDTEGRPKRVVEEVVDETERLKSAREIQVMRSYLKNIIDSMPSVLVGVDNKGRVTEWNLSAERITGVSAEQAVGKAIPALFPQLAGQLAHVSEAILRREPIHTQRLPFKKDGETRYAEVMIYPLLSADSLGAVIRMDDITERIRIEQMMVQTEKMLSVGGLAAGMAHEINNPLSIIMQSTQNVLRRVSGELPANRAVAEELGLNLVTLQAYLEARGIVGFMQGILEAGSRASRIVADMLAFSRRSASEFVPNRLDTMLETVVRLADSDYDLKKKYDFRQIEVVRDYDPVLGEVMCDRPQIEQVFLNLIKNAAHAMAALDSEAQRRIILRTRREGDYARVEVEDNGPGMSEATRKRAFEPFFTTKEVGIGTGLGLSVSYFIITDQHRGTMSVSSHVGEGCRFIIRLPIKGAPPA